MQPLRSGQSRIFIVPNETNKDYEEALSIISEFLQGRVSTAFLPAIYLLVVLVGFPANAMALWVFLFRAKKRHPASVYMANMALCDLLFVVLIPFKVAYHLAGNNWVFGETMCKVLVVFFYGNMYGSVLFVACLSVQRYWAVVHPLSQQRSDGRLAIIMSVATWVAIWASTAPLYLYQHTATIPTLNITTCHDVQLVSSPENAYAEIKPLWLYFVLMGGFAVAVPTAVIAVAYVLTLRALSHSKWEENSKAKRRKAVLLIVTVLVTFLLCFVPSNVMLVVHYSLLKSGAVANGYGAYVVTLSLASLNSCLDPLLYYYASDDFRQHVKNTLLCRSMRSVDRMKASFNSLSYSKQRKMYVSASSSQTHSSSG